LLKQVTKHIRKCRNDNNHSCLGFVRGPRQCDAAGGRLRRVLTLEQLSAESKDAVKLALGLVAAMTAILLGLLISSAKNAFDTAGSEVMQMAAKVAFLDRVLVLYGPETAEARRALREAVAEGVRPDVANGAKQSGAVRPEPANGRRSLRGHQPSRAAGRRAT
jgi:hypothetical protein